MYIRVINDYYRSNLHESTTLQGGSLLGTFSKYACSYFEKYISTLTPENKEVTAINIFENLFDIFMSMIDKANVKFININDFIDRIKSYIIGINVKSLSSNMLNKISNWLFKATKKDAVKDNEVKINEAYNYCNNSYSLNEGFVIDTIMNIFTKGHFEQCGRFGQTIYFIIFGAFLAFVLSIPFYFTIQDCKKYLSIKQNLSKNVQKYLEAFNDNIRKEGNSKNVNLGSVSVNIAKDLSALHRRHYYSQEKENIFSQDKNTILTILFNIYDKIVTRSITTVVIKSIKTVYDNSGLPKDLKGHDVLYNTFKKQDCIKANNLYDLLVECKAIESRG